MPRWTDVSADPNSAAAVAYRLKRLKEARRPPTPDRGDYLVGLVRGKRVLDVGIVDHTLENIEARGHRWLHGEIVAAADYCLGVDIVEIGIEKLREQGYNVRTLDIAADDPGQLFDLVVLGELIEHIGEPTKLFENVRRMLTPGGRLVLTTPNPHCISIVGRFLRGRARVNVDHVSFLFPSGIAELAERAGMKLVCYRGVLPAKLPSIRRKLSNAYKHLLAASVFVPEAICDTYIYECVADDAGDS